MKNRKQSLGRLSATRAARESGAVDSLQEAPSNHQQGISKTLQSLWTASENNVLYVGHGRGTSLRERPHNNTAHLWGP